LRVHLLQIVYPRLEDPQLFVLKTSEDLHSAVRVDEALGLHQIEESLDCVLLLDQVEAHHRVLPLVVEHIKLVCFFSHQYLIELIVLSMLDPILLGLLSNPGFNQLIHLRCQEESDIH
jgi:hypothetical protein